MIKAPRRQRNVGSCKSRLAAVYIAVLATALLVTLLALTGLKLISLESKSHRDQGDALIARQAAKSGLAIALAKIKNDPNWFESYPNGEIIPLPPLDNSQLQFSIAAELPFREIEDEQIRLTSYAQVDRTASALRVDLLPSFQAIRELESGVHVTGICTINALASGSIATDGRLTVDNLLINLTNRVTAASFSIGSNAESEVKADFEDYYLSIGTQISYSSLPVRGAGGRGLENIVLTPTLNPFGSEVNASGVYVIDCASQRITISNCRIEGTLLLLNPGENSEVTGSLAWGPSESMLPALLVRGSIRISAQSSPLSESESGVNFNPTNAAYQGESDSDLLDIYPSMLRGLIYVSGNAVVRENNTICINGSLIAGASLTCSGPLNVIYDPSIKQNPPPMFRRVASVDAKPGTIRMVDTMAVP